MQSRLMTRSKFLFLLVCIIGSMLGCSVLREMATVQKPQVQVKDLEITGLDFQHLDLALNLNVQNPNAIGIRLGGLDYEFQVEKMPFISGNQPNAISVPAGGNVSLQVPISFTFAGLQKAFSGLAGKDSTDYTLKVGLAFDLPVIGKYRVPVEKSGKLPILKIPKISLSRLRVIQLDWSTAEIELDLQIENPNPFSFRLDSLNYAFSVEGLQWVTGKSKKGVEIPQKGLKETALTFSLDFRKVGSTVLSLLQQKSGLEYTFQGILDLSTSVKPLGNIRLPFDLTGNITPTR